MEKTAEQIADSLIDKTIFSTKEVLTSDEAARYMGISKSYLYKLTMRREIPHYKPMGKLCYFNREELEQWLQEKRVGQKENEQRLAKAKVNEHDWEGPFFGCSYTLPMVFNTESIFTGLEQRETVILFRCVNPPDSLYKYTFNSVLLSREKYDNLVAGQVKSEKGHPE